MYCLSSSSSAFFSRSFTCRCLLILLALFQQNSLLSVDAMFGWGFGGGGPKFNAMDQWGQSADDCTQNEGGDAQLAEQQQQQQKQQEEQKKQQEQQQQEKQQQEQQQQQNQYSSQNSFLSGAASYGNGQLANGSGMSSSADCNGETNTDKEIPYGNDMIIGNNITNTGSADQSMAGQQQSMISSSAGASYSRNNYSSSGYGQNSGNSVDQQQQQNNADVEQYIKSLSAALTQAKSQTWERQARAAISVLVWQGYDQLVANNGTSCRCGGQTNEKDAASMCGKHQLDDVAMRPPYGATSGSCVSVDQVPTNEQIIAMIRIYSDTYGLINGMPCDITISDSSSDAEITSAIGTMMRQTSQQQQQLQTDDAKQ